MFAPAKPAPIHGFPAFLLFDRAARFLSPRPHIIAADARRCCQGWPLVSGHRRLGLYCIEHDGILMGSGRIFRVVAVLRRWSPDATSQFRFRLSLQHAGSGSGKSPN
jgi:hypothetical protein